MYAHTMTRLFIKIYGIVILILIGAADVHAQPESIGTAYSFSGFSISYQHKTGTDSFIEASIKAELGEKFLYRCDYPGASASVCWNMILKEIVRDDVGKMRIFAGAGAHFGWSNDFKIDRGFNFGLKGRLGVESTFRRNIAISVSVAPIIGLHMVRLEDSLKMEYFRNGLLNAIMPEIGIRYTFR